MRRDLRQDPLPSDWQERVLAWMRSNRPHREDFAQGDLGDAQYNTRLGIFNKQCQEIEYRHNLPIGIPRDTRLVIGDDE